MKTKFTRWLTGISLLLVVVGALAWIKVAQIGKMIESGNGFKPPPESVTSIQANGTEWQEATPVVATLVAVHAVTLSAELPGTVREIAFDSGASVRKGAVLVRLDTSTEEALLESAIADASLAKITLERTRTLRKSNANTPADLDVAEARAKQTDAQVANLQATIAKKTIRAPFDGRIAIRQVELGQIVSPGAPMASLQSVDPIHAEFWLGQQALADLKLGQEVDLRTEIFRDVHWTGKLSTINTEVDVSTRNVRVRATVPNADGRLRPGMFVNVDILSAEKRAVVAVPATAVLYAPYGDSVFVLEKEGEEAKAQTIAHQRFVRLGERRGDLVAVVSGLKAGEVVVSSGAFKLRNGVSVTERNDLAPSAELNPKPAEE
jgi:membrane fusion protein (multidrug efflux system)